MPTTSTKATAVLSLTIDCGDNSLDLTATVRGTYWPPGRPARPTDIDPPDPEMIEDAELVTLSAADGSALDCPAWLARLIVDNADDAIREAACDAYEDARERAAEDRLDA